MVTLKLPFRLSDGQSRPFHSSWVASTDCTNVTLGQANLILTQRVGEDHYGQNELQRVKSEILREETLAAHKPPPPKKKQADLRSQTVPRCDRTLLHAGSLSLGRNFHQRHVTSSLLEDLRESSRKIED